MAVRAVEALGRRHLPSCSAELSMGRNTQGRSQARGCQSRHVGETHSKQYPAAAMPHRRHFVNAVRLTRLLVARRCITWALVWRLLSVGTSSLRSHVAL